MHVDRGVQRRRAGAVREVDVGALLHEERRDVVVAVDDGEHQRRAAVGIDRVEIGAGVGERRRRRERALPRRVHQRRPSAFRQHGLADVGRALFDLVADDAGRRVRIVGDERPGVEAGAGRHERPHGVRAVVERRPHQRRRAGAALGRVHVPGIGEQLHGVHVAGAGRQHQERLAFGQRGVRRARRSAPAFSSAPRTSGVAGARRNRQRRHAVPVHGVDIRAGADEQGRRSARRPNARPSGAPSSRPLRAR